MKRLTISIADDVDEEITKRMDSLSKTNRSEFIEALIRFALQEKKEGNQ